MNGTQRDLRNKLIVDLFLSGKTLAEAGRGFGITRERARQIVAANGVAPADGGWRLVASIKRENRKSELEEKSIKKYGFSRDEMTQHRSSGAILAYRTQRNNAAKRGIKWEFIFKDWWDVWQASGHWHERGRGFDYVMARHGDVGPYSPSNVYICTQDQNMRDYNNIKRRLTNALSRDI